MKVLAQRNHFEYLAHVEAQSEILLSRQPLVSIILPTFNQDGYLKDAIDSVMQQEYYNFELIIINDGSTDGTSKILEKFLSEQRIKIYDQSNQGLPNAINVGIAKSMGELITWTSSDNLMSPQAISLLVEGIRQFPSASLVYGDYEVIDHAGKSLSDDNLWRHHNRGSGSLGNVALPRDGELRKRMPDNFIGPYFMFKKSIIEKIGLFARIQGIEDYDYWLRCERIGPIVHIKNKTPSYKYRVHDNTLSAMYGQLKIVENVKKLMELQTLRDTQDDAFQYSAHLTEQNCTGFRQATSWATRRTVPFKVLFLLDSWGVGGLEEVVKKQVQYFLAQNCEVQIVVSKGYKEKTEMIEEIHVLFISRDPDFRIFVEKMKPDVVLCHFGYKYLSILDSKSIPYIQVFHNTYVWLSDTERAEKIEQASNSRFNVCVSASVASYSIEKFHLNPEKTLIISNGIDVKRLNKVKTNKNTRNGPSFLVAATYTPHKRQSLIIEAFKGVRDVFPDSNLTFVGSVASQNYFEDLQRRVEILELEKSVVLNSYSDDMNEIYSGHDIAVSASLFEGWSLSLSEAAYLGMPIVATNVGGAKELSKFTRVYLIENYPSSLVSIDASNIGKFISQNTISLIDELTLQMLIAATDFYRQIIDTDIKESPLWELDSDYASSKYYDLCVEVLNGKK